MIQRRWQVTNASGMCKCDYRILSNHPTWMYEGIVSWHYHRILWLPRDHTVARTCQWVWLGTVRKYWFGPATANRVIASVRHCYKRAAQHRHQYIYPTAPLCATHTEAQAKRHLVTQNFARRLLGEVWLVNGSQLNNVCRAENFRTHTLLMACDTHSGNVLGDRAGVSYESRHQVKEKLSKNGETSSVARPWPIAVSAKGRWGCRREWTRMRDIFFV